LDPPPPLALYGQALLQLALHLGHQCFHIQLTLDSFGQLFQINLGLDLRSLDDRRGCLAGGERR
jgi:hypothetical protein